MNNETLNYIILILIVVVLYYIYVNTQNNIENKIVIKKNKNHKKQKNNKKRKKRKLTKLNDEDTESFNLNDGYFLSKYDNPNKINHELLNTQYHKDYYDTITAINYLTSQKDLFNLGFLPVREVKPNEEIIEDLTNIFISNINHEIKNNVNEYNEINSGWNDMGKKKRIKNGFEQHQEDLGLPGTIHNEGAKKDIVKIIHIKDAKQLITDDQAQFTLTYILQKPHVKDQIVLKVVFFMEKEDLSKNRDDRENFFKKKIEQETNDNITNQDIVIENIFIVGFLTNDGEAKTKMDKFYQFDDIKNNDGSFDQSKILSAMLKKQQERSKEHSAFLCTMSDDDKKIHDVPSLKEYESYNLTRTIIDDLEKFPQDSFGDIDM